jgi:hypothetical protein
MDVSPVSVAVRVASMSTIKLLLERCSGIQGGQLLHFATEREAEDAVEVIELLLNLGCSKTTHGPGWSGDWSSLGHLCSLL